LQEGWRHVGCCGQYVLREKDVSASFVVDRKASASADAFFLIIVPSNLNQLVIRCFEAEGDRSAVPVELLPSNGGLQTMTKLELLYAHKSEKFDQLCAVAARKLGYGELSL
jgi:hypothetical protein